MVVGGLRVMQKELRGFQPVCPFSQVELRVSQKALRRLQTGLPNLQEA